MTLHTGHNALALFLVPNPGVSSELLESRLSTAEELHSVFRSKLQSLKQLRSEFEEAYTCEEVTASLSLESERRIAEKSHDACKKMFQSAENRFRRMEAVRRKRLAALLRTLGESRRSSLLEFRLRDEFFFSLGIRLSTNTSMVFFGLFLK